MRVLAAALTDRSCFLQRPEDLPVDAGAVDGGQGQAEPLQEEAPRVAVSSGGTDDLLMLSHVVWQVGVDEA